METPPRTQEPPLLPKKPRAAPTEKTESKVWLRAALIVRSSSRPRAVADPPESSPKEPGLGDTFQGTD